MGVEPFLLPDSLLAVLAQRLVRRLCPRCREPIPDPAKVFDELGVKVPANQEPRLWRSVGCESCNGTGFKGRQGIFELMMVEVSRADRSSRRRP